MLALHNKAPEQLPKMEETASLGMSSLTLEVTKPDDHWWGHFQVGK